MCLAHQCFYIIHTEMPGYSLVIYLYNYLTANTAVEFLRFQKVVFKSLYLSEGTSSSLRLMSIASTAAITPAAIRPRVSSGQPRITVKRTLRT